MDKIAVLIPCYNEEQTISKVVGDVKKALPEAIVYVYDNNSTDKATWLSEVSKESAIFSETLHPLFLGLRCKGAKLELIEYKDSKYLNATESKNG